MGTSKSYSGPRGKPALLPAWATQGGSAPAVSPATGPTAIGTAPANTPTAVPASAPSGGPQTARPTQPATTGSSSPTVSQGMWTNARRSLSQVVSGSGGRAGVSRAGRSYVKALGGKRRATSSSGAGVRSTAALGGFLASVASTGLAETLRSQGLGHLVGETIDVVFAAICDLIAPAGGPLQDNVARESITEALEQLYDKLILDGTDATAIEEFSGPEIQQATETAIAAYVYNRWLLELGVKIEQHAITADRAVKLERDMKSYINDAVKLDFKNVNIMQLDWRGGAGVELIERLFEEAYSVLEEE